MPVTVQISDRIAAPINTALKLLNNCITDNAGKITSADINKDPTRFIARTTITAMITAKIKLIWSAFSPVALEKFSSNVTAKIFGYNITNIIRTIIDAMTHNQTSALESVRIDVDPKSVLHTSPLILAVGGNRFIKR